MSGTRAQQGIWKEVGRLSGPHDLDAPKCHLHGPSSKSSTEASQFHGIDQSRAGFLQMTNDVPLSVNSLRTNISNPAPFSDTPPNLTLILTGSAAFVPKCHLFHPQCSPSQHQHRHPPCTHGARPDTEAPTSSVFPALSLSAAKLPAGSTLMHPLLPTPTANILVQAPLPLTWDTAVLPTWSSCFLSPRLQSKPRPLLLLCSDSTMAPRQPPGKTQDPQQTFQSLLRSAPISALSLSSHQFLSSTHTPPSSSQRQLHSVP